MSRSSTARILRGNGGQNVAAAPFALAIPDVGQTAGTSFVERLEDARGAGYQAGYEAALAAHSKGAEADRAERFERLALLLTQAAAEAARNRTELLVQAECEAVELAFELAQSIVQRELAVSQSLSTDAIRRAIGLIPVGEDLIVHLHPGDVIDAEDLAGLVPQSAVKVVADPSIEAGGCVVIAGPCHIDAQIGPALERARALIATVAKESDGEDAQVTGSSAEPEP